MSSNIVEDNLYSPSKKLFKYFGETDPKKSMRDTYSLSQLRYIGLQEKKVLDCLVVKLSLYDQCSLCPHYHCGC